MSVAEREIPRFTDFTEEMFIPPTANEDIKVTRILFTAANHITPKIARERPHMRFGGLNVFNPCLNQSKDFIRRGRLTPLLTNQHIPIPAEDASSNDTSYFPVPLGPEGSRDIGGPLEGGGTVSRLAYPGQQIYHILEGSPNIDGSGQRIGIVEIETLKGHNYRLTDIGGGLRADVELMKIQQAIFPDYPVLPVRISEFTELVKRAIDSNTGDIRNIAEEELPSCIQVESWLLRAIEIQHQNMAQAAAKGYAAPYEDIDLVILEQLGMHREDEHFKRTAQQAQQPQQPAKMSHEEFLAMKEEIKAEMRAEESTAKPFTYVPDVFTPNGVNPSLCAICGFAKTNRSAHPENLQVNKTTTQAPERPKGR